MRESYETSEKAEALREQADNIITMRTRVKGDAERKREKLRAVLDRYIQAGTLVHVTNWYGAKVMKVLRVNKKTYTLQGDCSKYAIEKEFCVPVVEGSSCWETLRRLEQEAQEAREASDLPA